MKRFLSLALVALMIVGCAATFSACKPATYDDLMILDLGLEKEYFGIAFREGSDMTRRVEDITLQLIQDGKLEELSEKYEVVAVSESEYTPSADPCNGSGDYDYIMGKGTLVIGITDYKPMDYKEEGSDEWVGFDAEYAKLVCAALGVTAVFREIEWDNKLLELEGKTVDCIWNGMTITDAIENAADCTQPYMYNTQVAVINKKKENKYKSLADLAGKSIAAEGGSAGEKVIKDNKDLVDGLKSVSAQTDAILEVLAGTSDAAIVDLTLARALIGD